MRNLTLVATTHTKIQDANITATAIDTDQNVIYASSENLQPDGDVEVEIWKIFAENILLPSIFSKFTTIASSCSLEISQVISFRVLAEPRKLCSIMRSGDITMTTADDDGITEVEGTVESGLLAASWNPDDSLLALVTGDFKLILMTSAFDVLSESPLYTSDFGEDSPINVGWGSKQTQFHGSVGKAAAQVSILQNIGTSPDDDEQPRISWRGDGAFFVVSSFSQPIAGGIRRRVLRVYNREAILQSTSESVAGLEHPVAWRPSGNLIASTQRFGFEGGGAGKEGRHDVVFFERNGLRHGEFGIRNLDLESIKRNDRLRWGYKVRELCWSSDSNVLALWIQGDGGDIVQLWTIGNYHWYLKQEISATSPSDSETGKFTSVSWHPEQALSIILTTRSEVFQRIYAWETFTSHSKPPFDSGTVAVIDGTNILLTPFRVQTVPPPMSSCKISLSLPRVPVYVNFSPSSDDLIILWETGYVEIWSLRIQLEGGREEAMDPIRIRTGQVIASARQIQICHGISDTSLEISVVAAGSNVDILAFFKLGDDSTIVKEVTIPLTGRNFRLVDSEKVVCQSSSGEMYHYNAGDQIMSKMDTSFPEFCLQSRSVSTISSGSSQDPSFQDVYLGLGNSGKLHVASQESSQVLASNVTSFTVAAGYVIFTTSAHEANFVPLNEIRTGSSSDKNPKPVEWETRRLERGSRIVVAVPSAMRLVLQMPRGNLEAISPRPLVMAVVKQHINAVDYRKAFLACRKHRIDLNIIVERDQRSFFEHVTDFVNQIYEVEHLNLFLTDIGRGKQVPEIISRICDAVRIELENKDLVKYVKCVLTSHVVKTPPDLEASLSVLHRLQASDSNIVEDAVKYVIFLVDADQLFDVALGMYDFSLVLMIAQHSQKDPREYLPFLRELRSLDKHYQRFRIDDHLERYESALRNLSLAGPERFGKAIDYFELHQLYEAALKIWKNTEKYKEVLEHYGDHLFERREFKQAAAVLVQAKKPIKALVAYEKALQWEDLFCLAAEIHMPEDDIIATGYRVAENLALKKRHVDAARVLIDYSKDIREAVIILAQGNYISEARRVIAMNARQELIDEIIKPAALESCAQVLEEISECRDQLRKQVNRLRELRIKQVQEPDTFYGEEDVNLHNVDVMTDISMVPTTFTRYTVAPSTASRTSKRSSRSKRKLERKVGSGRKGTIDEEEYLLKSITKLTSRYTTIQDDAEAILPHLLQFTENHRREGNCMQRCVANFEEELKDSLDEIWHQPPEEVPGSRTTRMKEGEKGKYVNAIDKISKPILPSRDSGWRMKLLDLE